MKRIARKFGDIPKRRKAIKCIWIFKNKRNGIFKARLVSCGYSQILGVNFDVSFAPVIKYVSFRSILIVKLIWRLEASIIVVKTAFLHGELIREIYMNIPEGLNEDQAYYLQSKKTIYRLVHIAREFYRNVRIKRLESVIDMVFHRNYRRGLIEWIQVY
jgi:hypothetical protein